MDIGTIKGIIKDQREEIEEKLKSKDAIKREYLPLSKNYLKHPNILTILGVRRCGKSFFSMQISNLIKANTGYINFEDERLASIKVQHLDKVLQAFYELYGKINFIILDEIQNVEKWELFAARLRRTKKVIITGSNSRLLSGELATHLTGRHIDITISPFSFREISPIKQPLTTFEIAKTRKLLERYLNSSSFPEYRIFGKSIVRVIYEDIIYKDCIRRYKIKKEGAFRELTYYLISNFSNEFSYSKLAKMFKLGDVHTAKNYVSYLENSYAIITLKRFSYKLKEQELAPRKTYNIDQGFSNFVAFKQTKDVGKIYENTVLVDLLRRNVLNETYSETYYYKTPNCEVDFIIKQANKVKQLIQVCYNINDLKTKEREIRALIKASKELKCKNLLVITDDYEAEKQEKWFGTKRKVRFTPLWKWLLKEADDKADNKFRKHNRRSPT